MKKLVLLASLCLAVVMFSSCLGTNHMTYNALSQTEVVLTQSNFNVVGTAEGSHTVSYIFGLGGTSKSDIRENAVQQMYKNANLRGSQIFECVNVLMCECVSPWRIKRLTN